MRLLTLAFMFSVLIPCYNQDVTRLINDLHQEGLQLSIPFEIRCYDDGSAPKYKENNSALASLDKVRYTELPTNIGRSAIRQKLAAEAAFDKLIFLDGDSGLTENGLLKEYHRLARHPFVAGGRIYPPKPPDEAALVLHWVYGVQRETVPMAQRKATPAAYFHSNNFMIDKQLFLDSGFDQGLEGYGYEDLLFAKRLQQKGIEVKHITNPIIHLQLDAADAFLEKTRNAVKNLKQLNAKGSHLDTRLEKMATRLKSLGLSGIVSWVLEKREPAILNNLRSSQPRMRLMDYYKLLLYLR